MTHCGGCGMSCAAFGDGGQLQGCISGQCKACGGADQPCCRLTGCGGGLSCQGMPGTPESRCACANTATTCGEDACVDLSSDEQHCGDCATACATGEVCLKRAATASCVACGALGEPCCDGIFGFATCAPGNACGPDRTCVRAFVAPASADDAGSADAATLADTGARAEAPSDGG